MNMERIVKKWIEERFELDKVTLEPFPIFPAGIIIKDQEGGQMVVFYDILQGRVDYRFPNTAPQVAHAITIYKQIKNEEESQ